MTLTTHLSNPVPLLTQFYTGGKVLVVDRLLYTVNKNFLFKSELPLLNNSQSVIISETPDEFITSMAYLESEQQIICFSKEAKGYVVNLEQFQVVDKFETAHRQQITVSAAGAVIATSSPDRTVRIFDPNTHAQLKTIKVDSIVTELQWLNDDVLLIICQQETFVYNHKLGAVKKVDDKIATSAVCLSDELFLLSCRDNTLNLFGYSAGADKLVQLKEQFADEHYF